MRILYITTVGLTTIFFKDIVRELLKDGNTVDIATNEDEYKVDGFYRESGCRVFQVDFSRSPLKSDNLKAYKQLSAVIKKNHYDIVHCHTPVAGVLARLACRSLRRKGLRVIYTAHGFHFYRGAPLKNWLIFYPVEKLCSFFTDVLITINREDYVLAVKRMRAKRTEYVHGVGIDADRFKNAVADRTEKRRELGIPNDAFLLISVGELNENKNHQVVIKALSEVNEPRIHYMIAGQGSLSDYLRDLAEKLECSDRVHLIGYRDDVPQLYKTADINVFPSVREGLGLAALEGIASGLPLICSDNRGTREFSGLCENVTVCDHSSISDFKNAIAALFSKSEDIHGTNSMKIIFPEAFTVGSINKRIISIYKDIINEKEK